MRDSAGVTAELEPILSELWRAFGYPDGTPHIEDGEWAGEPVTVGNLRLP
ncbi:MAG: hypothetical protein IH933_00720 [Euryarchaeota archaeon]|nr:hypothetical protein [Euryarchaeota archaeon]